MGHIGNSRKLFPKTGGDTGDIRETYTRLFPDFAISDNDAGDFTETISRSIS